MPLLNYTTKVPVPQSIREITVSLVKGGASSIMQDYDSDGIITSISFRLKLEENIIDFRLPSDFRAVLQVLTNDGVNYKMLTPEHAQRVSWRILKDWVQSQMALLATKSVTMPQLFLPYAVGKNGKTLYEQIALNQSLLLGDGKD